MHGLNYRASRNGMCSFCVQDLRYMVGHRLLIWKIESTISCGLSLRGIRKVQPINGEIDGPAFQRPCNRVSNWASIIRGIYNRVSNCASMDLD